MTIDANGQLIIRQRSQKLVAVNKVCGLRMRPHQSEAISLVLDLATVRALWRPGVFWVAVAMLALNLPPRFSAAVYILCDRGPKVGCVTDILEHDATSEDAARGIIFGTEASTDAVSDQLIIGSSHAGDRDQQQSKGGNCEMHGKLQIPEIAAKG